MNNELQTVIQGGAIGLLALVIGGVIYVTAAVLPSIKSFFERLTASLGGLETRVAVVETKVDGVAAAVAETRTELGAAERRLAANIRREQTTDRPVSPNGAPSRRLSRP